VSYPQDPAVAEAPMDVLVIGCGLRAAGLLTATPALFDHDLGVLEASSRLAVGSFERYDIESNSLGTDFFGWIDPDGPFGPLLDSELVARLRSTPGAFRLSVLAAALAEVGRAIGRLLPPQRVLLEETVSRIELSADRLPQVLTRSGRRLQAHAVVLSTGIRERTSPELASWVQKSVPARSLIGPAARQRCMELAQHPGLICFAGASHSALSVLQRMLIQPSGPNTEIVLVTRSPVRLYYPSWAQYRAAEHSAVEAVPDPARDLCPETGNVHRYSGLRHGSRQLFLDVAAGRVPRVRLVVARSAAERTSWFAASDTLITAVGYESNLPPIRREGRPLSVSGPDGTVSIDKDGRLLAGGGAGEVFVMGMDPYPYQDNGINPTNQYKQRGSHILSYLDHRSVPEYSLGADRFDSVSYLGAPPSRTMQGGLS
jgi:hypothetical protein